MYCLLLLLLKITHAFQVIVPPKHNGWGPALNVGGVDEASRAVGVRCIAVKKQRP